MIPSKLDTTYQRETLETVYTTCRTTWNPHFSTSSPSSGGSSENGPPSPVSHIQEASPHVFFTFHSHGGTSQQVLKTLGSCLRGRGPVFRRSWSPSVSAGDRPPVCVHSARHGQSREAKPKRWPIPDPGQPQGLTGPAGGHVLLRDPGRSGHGRCGCLGTGGLRSPASGLGAGPPRAAWGRPALPSCAAGGSGRPARSSGSAGTRVPAPALGAGPPKTFFENKNEGPLVNRH